MNGETELALRYALRAESDYASALVIFEAERPGTANNVCYHCHQAAEKFLKAIIIENLERHPRTHDLNALLKKCIEFDTSFSSFIETCENLNDHNMDARYPDDYIEYGFEDAEAALRAIEPFREHVLQRLRCRPSISK